VTGLELVPRLRALLNEQYAIDLLKRAIACESITGNEAGFASLLADELKQIGIQNVTLRDFEPGRPNVWGWQEGSDKGCNLMFIGHTDTVHVNGWQEYWTGTERENPFCGAIINHEIWGRGTGDLKAGICATLAATELLKRAGVQLAGDVIFAFVGDEESGQPNTGVSAGMKALVPVIEAGELPKPDFAIYVEPTQLAVYAAQMGFFIADITITGKSAYFGVPELGKDALKAAHKVLEALWQHSHNLESRGNHQLIGNAFLLVTEISGGGYVAVPGECRLSLIRKLLPNEDLGEAARVLEQVIRGAISDPDIAVEVTYPAARDHETGGTPTEVDTSLPAINQLVAIVNEVLPGRGRIEGAPYWSEAPFLINKLGVPTVYFAPGDIRNCHTFHERVAIEDYLSGIVALAAFMADYCGVTEAESKGQ
jgi:acetylornithine deacetylase